MAVLAQIRQQLEQARNELQKECASLQAQIAAKTSQLEAINVLLKDEDTPAVTFVLSSNNGDEENLTNRAKEVLKQFGNVGARPRDLTRILRQQGAEVKETFASNFLWRMKNKTCEAVEVSGKYYWKGFEPDIMR